MGLMNDSEYLLERPGLVVLLIKLQPRSSRNEIGAPLGGELKIKVTAPPVESAANEALLDLLSQRLDCPRSALQILRGHASRHKAVSIRGLERGEIVQRLRPD
jgi:uncharacterized protein